MSSIAKTPKRSKKTKCLGALSVLRPAQYEAFAVDSKLECIRALILPRVHQCGGGGALRQNRSLGKLISTASLVGGGLTGCLAAGAKGQGLSAFTKVAGRPATGIKDEAGSPEQGCLTFMAGGSGKFQLTLGLTFCA